MHGIRKTLSRASVYDWSNKFSEGHKVIQDTAVRWQENGMCFGIQKE
jgi:hypothetical protein